MSEKNIFSNTVGGTVYFDLKHHPQYRMAMDIRYFIQKEFNIYIDKGREAWTTISYIAIDVLEGKYKQENYNLKVIHNELDNKTMKDIIVKATQRNWNREWIRQGQEKFRSNYIDSNNYYIDMKDL